MTSVSKQLKIQAASALFDGKKPSELSSFEKQQRSQLFHLIEQGWDMDEAVSFIQRCGPKGNNFLEDAYRQVFVANTGSPRNARANSRLHGSAVKQMMRHEGGVSHHHPFQVMEENLAEKSMSIDDVSQQSRLQALKNIFGIRDLREKEYVLRDDEMTNYLKLAAHKARNSYMNERAKCTKKRAERGMVKSELVQLGQDPSKALISEEQNALFNAAYDLFEAWLEGQENLLKPGQKNVLDLLLKGYSQQDIASMLGINQGSVSRRIAKVKQILSKPVDQESDVYVKRDRIRLSKQASEAVALQLLKDKEEDKDRKLVSIVDHVF